MGTLDIRDCEYIEKFLVRAKQIDTFEKCQSVYDLLGISNINASYPEIEKQIDVFIEEYARKEGPKFKVFIKTVRPDLAIVKRVLEHNQREYNDYLKENDPRAKQLRQFFEFCTKKDGELDSDEKDSLINAGIEAGLNENEVKVLIAQWILADGVSEVTAHSDEAKAQSLNYYDILGVPENADYSSIKEAYDSEKVKYNTERDKDKASTRFYFVTMAWDCLKDPTKKREYDEKLKQPKTPPPTGKPRLVIERKTEYSYKDIRRGTVLNVDKIVIKNPDGGLLQGTITSDVPWIEPDRNKVLEKHEQELYVGLLTSKIPVNTYDARGTLTIDTNGGPPQIIPFRVILEGLDIASERFRKTYVPLLAAFAGFICSFNSSPILNYLCGAALFGGIAYASSKIVVQYFLNEGIDIFQPPPVLIQTGAACVFILTIMLHSGGGNQNNVQPNIQAPPAEAPAAAPAAPAAPAAAAPAAPAAEAPAAAPAAEVQTTRTIDNIVYNNFIPSGSRVQIWAVENGRLGREISVQSWRQENGILHVTLAEDIPMGLMVQEKITPLNPQRNTSREDQQELERREENVRRNAMRDRQEQERRDNAVRDRQELEQERRNNAMRDRQEQERRDNAVRDRQEQRRSYDIRHNAMRDLRDRQEQERRDKNRERYPLQRTENASSRRNSFMNDLQ